MLLICSISSGLRVCSEYCCVQFLLVLPARCCRLSAKRSNILIYFQNVVYSSVVVGSTAYRRSVLTIKFVACLLHIARYTLFDPSGIARASLCPKWHMHLQLHALGDDYCFKQTNLCVGQWRQHWFDCKWKFHLDFKISWYEIPHAHRTTCSWSYRVDISTIEARTINFKTYIWEYLCNWKSTFQNCILTVSMTANRSWLFKVFKF